MTDITVVEIASFAPMSNKTIYIMPDTNTYAVLGLTETEAAALPELIERERGVCELVHAFEGHESGTQYYKRSCNGITVAKSNDPRCPSCGRRMRIS